jgi:LmbE family N-acetylglucosaminyl deacetylase
MTRSHDTLCAGVAAVVGLALLSAPALAADPRSVPQPRLQDTTVQPHLGNLMPAEPPRIAPPPGVSPMFSSRELTVPEGLRLLVFAPHPDDETIAVGGLLQRVTARNGTARVVFVTNGDGYVDGVRREVRRAETSRQDFIEYGRRRHQEALQAAAHLGLAPSNTQFLGFPDDGIDDLWAGHWSPERPYRSPYTQAERPPYQESSNPRVEYDGVDLRSEISRALREFKPDWIVMPDPRDRHPDHCTTAVFVLSALRQLRQEDAHEFDRTRVLTYLVHSPDYPASPTWVNGLTRAGVGGSGAAENVLATTPWFSLPLSTSEFAAKQNAVSDYRSQVQVMNSFLAQFLRPFELFGELAAPQIMAVPREYATRFGHRR